MISYHRVFECDLAEMELKVSLGTKLGDILTTCQLENFPNINN